MSNKPITIINADDETFDREVIHASQDRPIVVDFWAPWCGPCRALTPILEKVIGEHKGDVVLVKVNIDESPGLAGKFRIQGIPLVIGFRDGKAIAEFEGVQGEPGVREFVARLLPSEADRFARDAATMETTDPALAEVKYRQALEREPRHENAALGLARLLLARDEPHHAIKAIEEVGTTGPQGEEAERIRAVAALQLLAKDLPDEPALRKLAAAEPKKAQPLYQLGCVLAAQKRYPEALELLLTAAERDPKLASSGVREAMVKIFQVVGPQSALANDYRDKLSALLF